MKDSGEKLHAILVVEDEEDHARIIMKALKKNGHQDKNIQWAINGQEAIDYLHWALLENPDKLPGLILLDLKMPLKNGFDVLNEIKSNSNLRHIPIVMLTTSSNSDDIREALKTGANDYIVKPVRFSEFIEKVNKLGYYWEHISDASELQGIF